MNRSNKQRWKKRESDWQDFIKSIGGISTLNFGWTRQSGKQWKFSLAGDARGRNQLRHLIREGVFMVFHIHCRFLFHYVLMFGII